MWQRNQLVDLRIMLRLPPETLHALGYIAGCRAEWKLWVQLLQNRHRIAIAPPNITLENRAFFLHHCGVLEEAAKVLGLKAAQVAARRAREEGTDLLAATIGYDNHRLSRVVDLAEQLLQVFGDEILGGSLLVLDSRHAEFFNMAEPFGPSVGNSFPSATFDISEAAKCRAVARWTACVMHLMRVLETGLGALASHYGVAMDRNWNKALNDIEAKTREVSRRTHGEETEQWAAEAATHLRFVKNAWRNFAMHSRQVYDEESAVEIFDNSRAFMQHLSERLCEDDLV